VPRVSVVIRTRDEERWIPHCLRAVFAQRYRDFEVVLVDNQSRDGTLARARRFPVRVVHLERYRPGLALNTGIRAAGGELVVCLSGHCVPTDDRWLERLVAGFEDPAIAGVYGRQLPMSWSSPRDKRDLFITFGLDRRVQVKDSFFHNANSALRRSLWQQVPFDEEATNIEDRIWAGEMIARGHRLLYEPEAAVYHHHGIHHGGDDERARSTAQVLERLQGAGTLDEPGSIPARDHRVLALVPVKGEALRRRDPRLLDRALEAARDCPLVDEVVVLSDCPEAARRAESLGARAPFLRRPEHSSKLVDLGSLYGLYLERLESLGHCADLVLSLEPLWPRRPEGLLEELLELAARRGSDSVVPVVKEYNYAWRAGAEGQSRVDAGDLPRPLKDPLWISVKGLGLVTRPEVLRQGRLLGDRVGLVEVPRHLAVREAGDEEGLRPDAGRPRRARPHRDAPSAFEVRGPE